MAHTHTHNTIVLLLIWNLSGTTRVSRCQKGKTNVDLLEQEIVSASGICLSTGLYAIGTCESAVCVRIESRVESSIKIRIRIESAVGPRHGTSYDCCRSVRWRSSDVRRWCGALKTRDWKTQDWKTREHHWYG